MSPTYQFPVLLFNWRMQSGKVFLKCDTGEVKKKRGRPDPLRVLLIRSQTISFILSICIPFYSDGGELMVQSEVTCAVWCETGVDSTVDRYYGVCMLDLRLTRDPYIRWVTAERPIVHGIWVRNCGLSTETGVSTNLVRLYPLCKPSP